MMEEVGSPLSLFDWFDDLSVRFIINSPQEELESSERICFLIEEAQWYYEDFIRPLDASLPAMNLRKFCSLMFQRCPLLASFSDYHAAAYADFLAYKSRVPVRGGILVNHELDQVILVKGWKKGARWSFPRGKINDKEKDLDCAIREVYEETGFDVRAAGLVPEHEEDAKFIEVTIDEQQLRLYVFRDVPMDTYFEPRTRKEISKIQWWKLSDLLTFKKERQLAQQAAANGDETVVKGSQFYVVSPFLGPLKAWIKQQKRADKVRMRAAHPRQVIIEDEETAGEDYVPSDAQPDYTDNGEALGHFDSLLARLRSSNQVAPTLPPPVPLAEPVDPAEALKRMLSINGGKLPPPPPMASKPHMQQTEPMNPLLAILRGNNATVHSRNAAPVPPETPTDQIHANAPEPATPHHHHPQPFAPFGQIQPPPQFPYSPDHLHQGIGHLPSPFDPGYVPQQPMASRSIMHALNPPRENLPQQAPQVLLSSHIQHAQQQAPSYPVASIPISPPEPPPPQLSNQKLALLQALQAPTSTDTKSNALSSLGFVPASVRPGAIKQSLAGSKSISPTQLSHAPAPSRFTSTQPMADSKPTEGHTKTLLGLFNAPAKSRFTVQQNVQTSDLLAPEPIELAAQGSPHPTTAIESAAGLPNQLPALKTNNIPPAHSPGLTSATVTGPLNAPEFEKIRKATQPGNVSLPVEKAADDLSTITALLRRQSVQRSTSGHSNPSRASRAPSSEIPAQATKPFQPTILKRPVQPTTPLPAGPQILSRSGPSPETQKTALLALFSKPPPAASVPVSEMPAVMTPTQVPAAPKLAPEASMSSIMSPVSPLAGPAVVSGRRNLGIRDSPLDGKPGRMGSLTSMAGLDSVFAGSAQGSGAGSPASSAVFGGPSMPSPTLLQDGGRPAKQQQQHSSAAGQQQAKSRLGSLTGNASQTPITSLDKNFLLGYLENVAKGAGSR